MTAPLPFLRQALEQYADPGRSAERPICPVCGEPANAKKPKSENRCVMIDGVVLPTCSECYIDALGTRTMATGLSAKTARCKRCGAMLDDHAFLMRGVIRCFDRAGMFGLAKPGDIVPPTPVGGVEWWRAASIEEIRAFVTSQKEVA